MWTRFLVVSFILVADLGGVWERTADSGETERLLSGGQLISPFAISENSDSALPGAALLCGNRVPSIEAQAPGQMPVCYPVIRNPTLADPYYSRAPPART